MHLDAPLYKLITVECQHKENVWADIYAEETEAHLPQEGARGLDQRSGGVATPPLLLRLLYILGYVVSKIIINLDEKKKKADRAGYVRHETSS